MATLAAEVRDALIDAGYRHFPHIAGDHVPLGADDNPARWAKFFFNERPGTRHANMASTLPAATTTVPALPRLSARPPELARSIELIKRRLARLHPDDMDAYYDIKDPVYDLIWDAALQWAQWNRWQPE